MKIRVKEKHIRGGHRCNMGRCPLALAISEATGLEAFVTGYDFFLSNAKGITVFRDHLSSRAQAFVLRYDNFGSERVEAFNFEIGYDPGVIGVKPL